MCAVEEQGVGNAPVWVWNIPVSPCFLGTLKMELGAHFHFHLSRRLCDRWQSSSHRRPRRGSPLGAQRPKAPLTFTGHPPFFISTASRSHSGKTWREISYFQTILSMSMKITSLQTLNDAEENEGGCSHLNKGAAEHCAKTEGSGSC